MFCPNCGKEVVEEATFCPYCRTKIKDDNIEINTNNNEKENNIKNNKLPKILILLLVPILLITVILFTNNKLKEISKKTPPEQNIEEEKDEEKQNSLEKLQLDYDNKNIDVNEYFTQLVYLAYSSDNLDSKYKSDYDDYYTIDQLGIPEIVNEHFDELDKDILEFYLTNELNKNIHIGPKEAKVEKQSSNNKNYKVTKLNNGDNSKEKAANHYFDEVFVSSNENFIIWYTSSGDDAVTKDQISTIANGLESAISKYEQLFGLNYVFTPYIDNKLFNEDDWPKAKELLEKKNISPSILRKAMSVYVYDTGSENVLASYNHIPEAGRFINRALSFFGILNDDGIVSYPYIKMNKRGIKNAEETEQVVNHELFHHMQYTYCMRTVIGACAAPNVLTEGMANFASALASNSTTSNNFLNRWANRYVGYTSTKLTSINHNGAYGYALYLYYNAFYKNVDNGFSILLRAHNEKDAISYIQNNTKKEDLIKTINYLAAKNINQDYDLNTLKANAYVTFKDNIHQKGKKEYTINPGSIDYFKIWNDEPLQLKIDSDFATIKLFGYKDKKFQELESTTNEFEFNGNNYSGYNYFYLALTNGNLLDSYNYTITFNTEEKSDNNSEGNNSEYKTSFDNYNIEIDMTTKASGVEVTQHSKGVVDELHQKEYLENDTSTMGMVISTKVYTDFVTGYSYTSQPFSDGVWLKDKAASQLVDLKVILKKLKDNKNIEKIDNNHFRVKLDKQDMQAMMEQANSDASVLSGDVEIDVYTENDYITKLEYDFTNMIKGFDLFKTTISFSNYNNAGDVVIPESVISNAKGN